MSRSAVVAGRTASDVVYNGLSVVIMSAAGFAVGWRIRGSVLDAVVAYALLLFFSYSFSWVMACLGLMVPTPEVVNNATFIVRPCQLRQQFNRRFSAVPWVRRLFDRRSTIQKPDRFRLFVIERRAGSRGRLHLVSRVRLALRVVFFSLLWEQQWQLH